MKSAHKVCNRCIMDTSDPNIVFNEQGICNHCAGFFQRREREVCAGERGAERLSKIIESIKTEGRTKEYDCVIGVSGGVDSTYVAFLAKKHGLRPLAVHFDNGWDSELAVDNIKKTLEKLDIDLVTCVVDWGEFKDLQLAFLRASVPNAEIPTDHAINALLYREAMHYKIRYVITGSNVVTEGIMPLEWVYSSTDYRHLRAIHHRFGDTRLKTLPTLPLAFYLYVIFVRQIKLIRILNYVDYNKQKVINILETELGWRQYGAKHFESVYTRFFQGHILPRKFGYDKRKPHLSCLICTGDLTRADALVEIDRDPYAGLNLDGEIDYVTKKLGIDRSEFDKIMNSRPKRHRDYPSNRLIFESFPQVRTWARKLATDL